MLPIARMTDQHSCPQCNRVTLIVEGSPNSTDDGLPIARVGDKTGCGAVITGGSSTATCDGKPIAYLGSSTSHGGTITTGSATQTVMP